MKTFKNIPSASLVFLGVIATVSNFALAKDPDADSCWRYTVGAHVQQGGSSPKQPCSGEQYCYVARKAKDNQGKVELHATMDEFVGGCAAPNDQIFSHPGISKDKFPSCSKQTHGGNDMVCVCNDDNCNKKDKIPDMLQQSNSLIADSGSQNLGYSLVLSVSALMIAFFFRA